MASLIYRVISFIRWESTSQAWLLMSLVIKSLFIFFPNYCVPSNSKINEFWWRGVSFRESKIHIFRTINAFTCPLQKPDGYKNALQAIWSVFKFSAKIFILLNLDFVFSTALARNTCKLCFLLSQSVRLDLELLLEDKSSTDLDPIMCRVKDHDISSFNVVNRILNSIKITSVSIFRRFSKTKMFANILI